MRCAPHDRCDPNVVRVLSSDPRGLSRGQLDAAEVAMRALMDDIRNEPFLDKKVQDQVTQNVTGRHTIDRLGWALLFNADQRFVRAVAY